MTAFIKYRISDAEKPWTEDEVKGEPLTNREIDANFKSIVTELENKADLSSPSFNGTIIFNADTAIAIPKGTTADREKITPPIEGMLRYNTDKSGMEFYRDGNWESLGKVAQGGGDDEVFFLNDTIVTENYNIPSGKNAMTAGPVDINEGVTIGIPEGSTWTVVGSEDIEDALSTMNQNILNLENEIENVSSSWDSITDKPTTIDGFGITDGVKTSSLASVAFSGNYDDLQNKPVIDATVTVDDNLSAYSTNPVQNKVIESAIREINNTLAGKASTTSLSAVATTGSYNDLSDKPNLASTIDRTSQLINDSGFLTAHQSLVDYVKVSSLAKVATSGSYKDLSNQPSLDFLSIYGGTISGSLTVTGYLKGGTIQATSDKRLKDNITHETYNLDGLTSYKYTMRDGKYHVGLIAQEVQEKIPEAVTEGDDGYLAMDYNSVVAVLVDEVNRLKEEIKILKSKI